MKIEDAMTKNVQLVLPTTSLEKVARLMQELNCGFLPISDELGEKLTGVVTDRDITIRGVAEGLNPETTAVRDIMSTKVIHCFAQEDLQSAADTMRDNRVYRLLVLDNPTDRRLCGILTLGDIIRHNKDSMAIDVTHNIMDYAA